MSRTRSTRGDRQFRLARLSSNAQLRRVAPACAGRVVNVSAGDGQDKEGGAYAGSFTAASSSTLTNICAAFRGFEGRANEIELDLSQPLPPASPDRSTWS